MKAQLWEIWFSDGEETMAIYGVYFPECNMALDMAGIHETNEEYYDFLCSSPNKMIREVDFAPETATWLDAIQKGHEAEEKLEETVTGTFGELATKENNIILTNDMPDESSFTLE